MIRSVSLFIVFFFGCLVLYAQDSTVVARKPVSVINKSNRVEFAPTISADGRTMIFETQTGEKWELYQTTLNDAGEWSEPVPLKAINDKCDFIAGPSLSYDGNTLYYTAFIEGTTGSEDIFFSERLSSSTWSEPKPIGAPINTDGYDGFPSISANGNSLYFIRINPENDFDKKSKEPCFTIYVANRDSKGIWTEPKALPGPVNSGCERDPRIMADNHTLIFSSIRPGGKGKFDLYQSRLQDDKTWSAVQPLVYVNSADNDQSPCISASGNTMFYFSKNDIYEIPIPKEFRQMINVTLKGDVKDLNSQLPVVATITVKDLATGTIFTNESNPSDGRFTVVMKAGASYEITFGNDKYVPMRKTLDYSSIQSYMEEKLDVSLSQNFTYRMSVKDKEIAGEPLTAMLTLKDRDGKILLSDSVSSLAEIPAMTLIATGKYSIEIASPGYHLLREDISFSPRDLQPLVNRSFLLEHEKVQVVADVTDISTGERKRMKVSFNNETSDEVIVADAGEVVNLRKGDRYQVVANSEKGFAYTMKSIVAGEGHSGDGPLVLALPVAALVEGAKLTLNNIYFETNSANLSDASRLELINLIQLLQKNPQIVIEISAHTDDVGADHYNLNLSQKRASSVTEYLTEQGIPIGQLVAKGYGKSKPVVANDSDENRALNRRVELLVVRVQ